MEGDGDGLGILDGDDALVVGVRVGVGVEAVGVGVEAVFIRWWARRR